MDTMANVYGFTCSCFLCSNEDVSQEREARRLEVDRLHTRIEELGSKEGKRDKDQAWTMATPGSDGDPLPTIRTKADRSIQVRWVSYAGSSNAIWPSIIVLLLARRLGQGEGVQGKAT